MRRSFLICALSAALVVGAWPTVATHAAALSSLTRSAAATAHLGVVVRADHRACTPRAAASAGRANGAGGWMLLGDRSVERAVGQAPAGLVRAFPFRSKTSGTATTIRVYVSAHNRARRILAAIYSAGACGPGSRLTVASVAAKPGRWDVIKVRPIAIQSGRTYWLALLGSGGTLALRERNTQSCSREPQESHAAALPVVWTKGLSGTGCEISAFVAGNLQVFGTLATGSSGSGQGVASPPADAASGSVGLAIGQPTNVTPPVILGAPVVGEALTASPGTWTGSPTTYGYQWQDCSSPDGICTNIPNGTTSTYTVSSTDVGQSLRVVVTAGNSLGSAFADSVPTTPVVAILPPPSNTGRPTISGVPQAGNTLTTTTGSWANNPTNYAYQWQDCNSSGSGCTNLSGANTNTYVLTSTDVGYTIDVVVTATNASGSTAQASNATSVVTQSNSAFVCASGARCFYVDYASGSDSNSGTSEASPWQHAPGMQGCSSRCAATTPQADDYYILKGGVTWPNSALPWVFHWSGSASHGIFLGVDPSWLRGRRGRGRS